MKRYFYLDTLALKKHINKTYFVSDERVENYKTEWQNSFEFFGENLFKFPVLENNKLREATTVELINMGVIQLQDDEFLENETIKSIYDVPCPAGIIHRKFDKEQKKWVEGATLKELENYYFNQIIYINTKIMSLKNLGLKTSTLESELEKLKEKHSEISYELAIMEDTNE